MEYKNTAKWLVYEDDSGNLVINDREEDITFFRGNLGNTRYNLAVVVGKEEIYNNYGPSIRFEGAHLIDEMTLQEWIQLARDYIRHKAIGEESFRKWINEEVYRTVSEVQGGVEGADDPSVSIL